MAQKLPDPKNDNQNQTEDMIEQAVAEMQAEVEAEIAAKNPEHINADAGDGLDALEDAIKSSLGEALDSAPDSTDDLLAGLGAPANDDRASVGNMMHSLQRQPAKTSYWTALLMSSVWMICGLTYGWVMFRDEMTGLTGFADFLAAPSLMTLTMIIIIPILFFFVLAVLTRRAQGLRMAALSMTEIATRLAEPEGVAKDAVASVGQAVRREVAAMGDGVERAIARAGELEALVHSEVSALERAYGDNEIRIKGLVEELVSEREAIQTNSEAIRAQIKDSHQGFNTDIDAVTERITIAIAAAGDRLTESLEVRSAQITAAISSTGDSVSETLLARGTNLVEALAGKSGEITSALDSSTENINQIFETRKTELSENLSQAGTAIGEMMGTRNTEIGAILSNRTTEIGQFFTNQSTTAIQAMEQHSASVQSSIQGKVDETLETISVAGNDIRSTMIDSIDNAGDMLIRHNTTIGENLNAHAETLSGQLDTQTARINDVLGQRTTEISHTLVRAGGELLQNLNQSGEEINTSLTQSLGAINETLATRGTEVADRFTTHATQLEESMARQIETVGTTLSGRAGEMNDQLLSRIGELNQAIDTGGAELITVLADKTSTLDQTLTGHATNLGARVATINEAGNAVARAIEHKGSEVTKVLAEKGAEISLEISSKTGEISTELNNANAELTQQMAVHRDQLAEKGTEITDGITAKTAEIADHLNAKGAELTHKMVEHGEQIVEAMMTTDQGVAKNFTSVVERLSTTNAELHNILATAGDHLTAIEQGLGERAETFRSTIESATSETASTSAHIETQVAALQEVSSIVLKDISELSTRFEGQGHALQAAATAVSDSNDRMDDALRERHESLANLTTTLSHKAEEVDTMMRTFTGLVEDSLGSTEARAREIGQLLSDKATQSSQAIRNEFEQMNQVTGEENENALSAVRAQHLAMRDEIAQVIADARTGFDDMTGQMRAAVGQISQDLETTRSELRRSSVELPRETEEQANAMRRMVSDQIRALDELSTIVTRHGGGLDTSKTGAQPAYAPPPAPEHQPEPQPQSRPEPRQRSRGPSQRMEAARRVVESLPREPAPADNRNGDWSMQDLLAGASERDPQSNTEASPLHAVESLNSISVDLARVLDHEAPADLWNRYKTGERNVFTRRLYNLRGQRTFDDIKRKYSKEPEFRDVVDRYVDEFEGMIENVSRNDRDNILTQTYMTSDTGKVYLMLAHASGRFD